MEFVGVGGEEAVEDLLAHVVAGTALRGRVVDLGAGECEVVGLEAGGVEGGGEVGDEVWAVRRGAAASGVT